VALSLDDTMRRGVRSREDLLFINSGREGTQRATDCDASIRFRLLGARQSSPSSYCQRCRQCIMLPTGI